MFNEEKFGEKFSLEVMRAGQVRAWQLLLDMASQFRAGMSEEEALILAKDLMNKYQVEKNWHKVNIRFGENTLKTFSESSAPNTILQENDLFFIDLGPVWNNHEADVGATFFVGNNLQYKDISLKVKQIFEMTKSAWREKKLSGREIYQFAKKTTEDFGYELNFKMDGHRLSDFPHAVYFKGGLEEFDQHPIPDAWILEIQIKHPKLPFGAFYEDIL
jgi:Xaa-Pro aminopeptidase